MIRICRFLDRVPLHTHPSRLHGLRRARMGDEPREPSEPMSGLAEVIETRYGPTTPILEDLATFSDALRSHDRDLELQECCLTDDGECWLTLRGRWCRQEVRPGDAFVDGVIFTADGEQGTCAIRCRPVRLVCSNGHIMPLSHVLHTPEYVRGSDGTATGTIETVVTAAFSGRVLEVSAEMLRRTAQIPASGPAAAMAMLGLHGAAQHLPPSVLRRVQGEESTVYGILNAITRAARDSEEMVARSRLEQLAGRMIESASGLPSRAPSLDPQPV